MHISFGQRSYSFTVGKVWKSLVTIFKFGICHSPFLAFSFFFLCFKFESLYVIKFLLVPWATSYSSALAEALAIALVARSYGVVQTSRRKGLLEQWPKNQKLGDGSTVVSQDRFVGFSLQLHPSIHNL